MVKTLKISDLIVRILTDLDASNDYKVLHVLNKVNVTFFFDDEEYIEYSFSEKFFKKYLTHFINVT